MALISDNDEYPGRNFGNNLKFTNWVLDSGATRHMTPEVSGFIPGLLNDMNKHIEVADVNHVMAKPKRQVQIKCATITEILLLQHYKTYCWHHIYATGYFPLLR